MSTTEILKINIHILASYHPLTRAIALAQPVGKDSLEGKRCELSIAVPTCSNFATNCPKYAARFTVCRTCARSHPTSSTRESLKSVEHACPSCARLTIWKPKKAEMGCAMNTSRSDLAESRHAYRMSILCEEKEFENVDLFTLDS